VHLLSAYTIYLQAKRTVLIHNYVTFSSMFRYVCTFIRENTVSVLKNQVLLLSR